MGPSLPAVAIATASLFGFIIVFVAFMLAPLLMIAIVTGSMWGYEKYRQRKRQPAVRRPGAAPGTLRTPSATTTDVHAAAPSFAFGQSSEEGL